METDLFGVKCEAHTFSLQYSFHEVFEICNIKLNYRKIRIHGPFSLVENNLPEEKHDACLR